MPAAFLAAILILASAALGQTSPLLVEDFDYPAGSLLTANGWAAHSAAGTNAITVTSPGLTYPGYPGSGVGNAATLNTSGEDVNKTIATPVTSGTVYASALINVSQSQANGDYFFHLFQTSSTFFARVYVKKDATTNNYFIGISKSSTQTPTYTATAAYAPGTTVLVVVKYTFNSGSTTDDTVELFINPVPGSAEPAASLTPDNTAADAASIAGVALRQGSAANAANVVVDGIRMGTTWASVTAASTPVATNDAVVDMNGDGKTDYVVVRPDGGTGSQLTWYPFINGVGPAPTLAWGISGDQIISGDYDGDRKDDAAVFRGSNGTFYIINSSTMTMRIDQFGQNGDDARVVGDYNGDGKDDVAVYRSGAESYWFYKAGQNELFNMVSWGQTGDTPAPGDYDGDGKADFVVRRAFPSSTDGVFWVRLATNVMYSSIFGQASDKVVPGDYDGDGKTDMAVVRLDGSNLAWHFKPSGGGANFVSDTWGIAGDMTVQGDYTGDGKTDYAIWRPSTGTFYVMTVGQRAIYRLSWGQSGDYPVANYNTFD